MSLKYKHRKYANLDGSKIADIDEDGICYIGTLCNSIN